MTRTTRTACAARTARAVGAARAACAARTARAACRSRLWSMRLAALLLVGAFACSLCVPAFAVEAFAPEPPAGSTPADQPAIAQAADALEGYRPGVVLVTLDRAEFGDATAAAAELAIAARIPGCRVVSRQGSLLELALPEDVSVSRAIAALRAAEGVQAVQPDYRYAAHSDARLAAGDSPEFPSSFAASASTFAAASAASASAAATAAAADPAASAASTRDATDSTSLSPQTTTDDAYVLSGALWALDSVRAYEAWDSVRCNGSVAVAVLDTGFNVNHEDLADNIVASFNASAYDYSEGLSITDAMRDVSGYESHGTHVAGIVGARANNGKGVAGVSYNASIVPVKVFNSYGNTSTSVLMNAFDYVIAQKKAGLNVRVINLSLGGGRQTTSWSDYDLLFKAKIDEAHDQGIVTVVSAGNEGDSTGVSYSVPFYCFPGDLDNVVTVISLKKDGSGQAVRYDKSNFNVVGQTTKNVSAPGNLIMSTFTPNDDSYKYQHGTSMAAPYVSGVLALMFAANPDLAPDQAISRLYSTARDLAYSNVNETAPAGWDRYTGIGEIDAAAAVAPSATSLDGTASLKVGATVRLAPSNDDDWTWTSSDASVASVSNGVVTGRKAGTATITASNADATRFAARVVSVYSPAISGASSVSAGSTASYSVPAVPLGTYTWASSNASVATINASGVLTARAVGTTTITVALASNPAISATKTVSVERATIGTASVSVGACTYSGKVQKPAVSVRLGSRALVAGRDYSLSFTNNVNAGTAYVRIAGIGSYSGMKTVPFTIARAANPLKLKAAKKTVKASALKKKAQTTKPLTVVKRQGVLKFKKKSGAAGISVNAKTGALKLKKGLKKGTYKVKVATTAAGTANYLPATKTTAVTIKVT